MTFTGTPTSLVMPPDLLQKYEVVEAEPHINTPGNRVSCQFVTSDGVSSVQLQVTRRGLQQDQ